MAEETFYKIVQHIFSNWTGLKLAVEHSMGGPNSKQLAIECIGEVTQYCIDESNLDQESLEDFLEDTMDEKFDTIFEDGSPKEIATVLLQFVQLLKSGNVEQCEEEFRKLPVANTNWLQESRTSNHQQVNIDSNSSSEDEDAHQSSEVPMEDDGWTVVQTRKKR
ncbi:unnamed protein product [Psylliodes chrysocephalus]|uniref:Pre-rRNA-processing protein TSR2 homolog n=1 Tax=Psylliodes chrysocephalus TaxID=3402493 RepID=A0A9P0CIH1_9CUCU|nr:unnamed protein product [Psylliodes chrysocephala]